MCIIYSRRVCTGSPLTCCCRRLVEQITMHMHVELVRGGSGRCVLTPGSSQHVHEIECKAHIAVCCLHLFVSAVYFDSSGLDVYHTRLAREDGARLVRVRYYGPRQTGPEGQQQPVFVERKTHRERWTGERSVKVRAPCCLCCVCFCCNRTLLLLVLRALCQTAAAAARAAAGGAASQLCNW
jgi:hypothetical protein